MEQEHRTPKKRPQKTSHFTKKNIFPEKKIREKIEDDLGSRSGKRSIPCKILLTTFSLKGWFFIYLEFLLMEI